MQTPWRLLVALLAAVSVVLWVAVGYLLALELQSYLGDHETEHSPWAVARVFAPIAIATTIAWYAGRRQIRTD